MFAFKSLVALALAGASAYAASVESRAPGPLGERVHCGILLKPTPELPTNWDRDAYKAELGQGKPRAPSRFYILDYFLTSFLLS